MGDGNHLRWAEHFVRIKGGGVLDVEQYGKIVSDLQEGKFCL